MHRLRTLRGMIWGILILQISLLGLSLYGSPWARWLPWWFLPVLLLGGLAVGRWATRRLARHRASRLPGSGLVLACLVVGTVSGGGASLWLLLHPVPVVSTFPALIVSVVAPLLALLMPWATLHLHRPIVVLVPLWVAVLGMQHSAPLPVTFQLPITARYAFTLQHDWWLTLFFLLSMGLLSLTALYQRVLRWETLGLVEHGHAVYSRLVRATVPLFLIASVIAIVPIGFPATHWFDRFWSRSGQNGTYQYVDPNGVPLSYLGGTLDVRAPPAASDTVVLYYHVLSGARNDFLPPLFGAAYVQYAGSTWQPDTTVSSVPFLTPSGGSLYQAEYTFAGTPRTPYLPMIGTPVTVSIPLRTVHVSGLAASPFTIVGWQATTPIAAGTTYTALSTVVPVPQVDVLTIPAPLLRQLRAVPPMLQNDLAAFTAQLAVPDGTPGDRAGTLLQRLRATVTIDPLARPTGDPIQWAIGHHRANENLFNTLYVLTGRVLGLPLRFVEGYAPGERFTDSDGTQRYRVRERDGLTWVQLALGAQGWYDLFPAGKDRVVKTQRNAVPGTIASPTATPGTAPPSSAAAATSPLLLIGGVFFLALVVVLCFMTLLFAYRWWALGRGRPLLIRMVTRLAWLSRVAGADLHASDTATAAVTKAAVLVPAHHEDLLALAPLYNQAVYDPEGDLSLLRGWRAWPVLRRALLRLIVARSWRLRRVRRSG